MKYEDRHDDDPYERGFADKLYEDYDEPPEYKVPPAPQVRYTPQDPTAPQTRYTPRESQRMAPRELYREAYDEEDDDSYDEPYEEKPRPTRRRKKHRVLRVFLVLLLVLALVAGAAIGGAVLLSKQPIGSTGGLGAHLGDSATILLAGTDESGDRTDTIMLLNINRSTKQLSLMSIPRDTKVNSTYTPHKINGAYGVNGGSYGEPEEGMDSLMDYVADCIGFRPDGYILLELDVFIELVDLFGGVEFDVPVDMYYEDPSQDLYINLKAGLQTLDGEQAMGVVRYRSGYTMADLQRVSVQRDFLMAAAGQWLSAKHVFKLPQALSLLTGNALTDLTARNLLWLAESALLCGTDDMQMLTIPYTLTSDYVLVDANDEFFEIINTYFNPYERAVDWDDLNIAY